MKFGKEFAAQLVQEWREAYMDYNYLKTILKQVLVSRQKNAPSPVSATTKGALKRRVSLYRAFSGLRTRYRGSPVMKNERSEDEAILVSSVGGGGGDGVQGQYQTMFLMSSDVGGEQELVFFKKLDDEFNKVVSFYKEKVEEVMSEADELSKQMDALIALRIKVDDPVLSGGAHMPTLARNGAVSSSSSASSVHPINGRKPGQLQPMDTIQEVEMSSEGRMEENNRIGGNENGSKGAIKGFRPASLDVLHHVKIKIVPETPVSTLRGVLTGGSLSDMSFSKRELKKAEELMTRAFMEFYQKLRLLKSYW